MLDALHRARDLDEAGVHLGAVGAAGVVVDDGERARHDVGVVAGAADEPVDAAAVAAAVAADQRVVTVAPVQRVVPAAAVEQVAVGAPDDEVVTRTAAQCLRARRVPEAVGAGDRVGLFAVDPVVAVAPVDAVGSTVARIAFVGHDQVVARAAQQGVGAVLSVQRVVTVAAEHAVAVDATDDHVVPVPAVQRLLPARVVQQQSGARGGPLRVDVVIARAGLGAVVAGTGQQAVVALAA